MKTIRLSFFLLILSQLTFAQNDQTKRTIDSLFNCLKMAGEDTVKARLYLEIGIKFESSNPDTAIYYYNKTKNLTKSDPLNPSTQILFAQVLLSISRIKCYYKSEYEESIKLSEKSIHIYNKLTNTNDNSLKKNMQIKKSICLTIIGTNYLYQGNYDYAITNYLKALGILNELLAITKDQHNIQIKKNISQCYTNIGIVHMYKKSYNSAIEFYLNALKIDESVGDKFGISSNFGNLGICYLHQKNYDSALEYFFKALKIFEEINDKNSIVSTYINIGSIHKIQNNFDKALDYFLKALKFNIKLGNKNSQAQVFGSITSLYLAKAQTFNINFSEKASYLSEAINYGNKSLKLGKEINALNIVKDATSNLQKAYKSFGNHQKALEYAEIYIATNDSMFSEEKTRAIADMETKYQTEKKQQEIELLNKDKELQNIEMKRQKMQKFAFIGGFALMLLLAVFIFRSYRNKKKANNILKAKNAEIQQQKEEIQAQSEQLLVINEELEKLSIVASKTDNSVVIADSKGEINWVNAGFTKLLGYTLEEFKSQVGSNIFTASGNPNIAEIRKKCEDFETVYYTVENTTRDGRKIWVQTTLTPIVNDVCEISKIVSIDSDITKLKEVEKEIVLKNEELGKKNIQIISSINYAKLIQDTILPTREYIINLLSDSFILYKPRDIVSGDFYWLYEKQGFIYFAVVDCTGHGVPGAFMSMVGNMLLNEIVSDYKILEPSTILDRLNEKIVLALKQTVGTCSQDDGMDITLCRFERSKLELQVAIAKQSLIIISKGELIRIAGDIFSIGGSIKYRNSHKYRNHKLNIESDTALYLFTDGFSDQFGGTNNQKFMKNRLEKLLLEIHHQKMQEQIVILEKTFNNWTGNNKQVDDVTILGIKI